MTKATELMLVEPTTAAKTPPHYERRPRRVRPHWLRRNRTAVRHLVRHYAQPLKPKNVIAR